MRLRTRALALLIPLLAVNLAAASDFSVAFSKDEIAIISGYYGQHSGDAGNGQQKNKKSKPLPPGIAKNLQRGKPLPPGIAKQRLPDDLVRQLPRVPTGYERIVVDGRVLLVEIATQVIHDVLVAAVFD